ncbi:MAG: hypothetical protein HRT87_00455 [Legionellales bacterium]|nr:hypothetical protein [Legionellales bacterium]
MVNIISHRINTIKELNKVDFSYGIEVDIRYHNNDLILHHDPFGHHDSKPVLFEDLLIEYLKNHKGTIILNVKTEGIELQCINLMRKYNYSNWFFLDLSMPYFVIYANKASLGEIDGFSPDNLAVRFSEFEPIEYALAFKDKAKWVWIDCFKKMPLNKENYKILKNAYFKLCLVAPELHKHKLEKTFEFFKIIKDNNIILDSVCTKNPDLWNKL